MISQTPTPPPKPHHKLRWILGLFGLLIVILALLQFREYDYWQNTASRQADSEREKKIEEMADRAISLAEEKLQAGQASQTAGLPAPQPTKTTPLTPAASKPQSQTAAPQNQNPEAAPQPAPAVLPPAPVASVPAGSFPPASAPAANAIPAMPVAVINYPPITEAMKAKTIDCEIAKLIVFRDKTKKYYCANIYSKDAATVKAEVAQQQPERVILFGQYLQLDCFISSASYDDPLGQCHQAATFLDRWQLPKMSEAAGIKIPGVYNYIYLSQSVAETNHHCGTTDAYGCFLDIPEYNLVIYTMQPSGSSRSFFDEGTTSRANLYARYQTGGSADIIYSMTIKKPQGCFVFENHELIHLLNQQAYGTAPYWADEGLVTLTQNYLYDNVICPPGQVVYNVTKKENGQVAPVPDFEIDDAYRQEPLNSNLVDIAQGRQCRKGIYMQISRSLDSGGGTYLKTLYNSLKAQPPVSEPAATRAVWESSGKSATVKQFLLDNGCTF